MPAPAMSSAPASSTQLVPSESARRDPREPGRLEREPDHDQRPAPDAVGDARPRSARRASASRRTAAGAAPVGQWRVATRELELLGDQERGGERRAGHQERSCVSERELAAAKQPQRHHRLGDATLPEDECDEQRGPSEQCAENLRARPTRVVRPHEPPHEAQHARGDERDAAKVQSLRPTVALGEQSRGQCQGDETDRDVDPEDPVPVDALRDGAPHERTDRDRQAGEPAVDAHDQAATRRGKRRRQDRQAERQHDRSAEALDRARGDQRAGARRQRARGRRGREQRQPDVEDAAPSEAVAECRCGDDAGGERDAVGVDRPLQGREADVKVLLHARQRRHDHERVERDHEVGRRGESEDPAQPAVAGGSAGGNPCGGWCRLRARHGTSIAVPPGGRVCRDDERAPTTRTSRRRSAHADGRSRTGCPSRAFLFV